MEAYDITRTDSHLPGKTESSGTGSNSLKQLLHFLYLDPEATKADSQRGPGHPFEDPKCDFKDNHDDWERNHSYIAY
jgi:hypothetical protein